METKDVGSNDAQLLIDKKILALEESIQKLRHERNNHTLIAKLPPEVLGNIFVLAAQAWRPEFHYSTNRTRVRFNFSHVSQYWRSVALSTPNAWGWLPDGSSEWCRAMLVRSKNADLLIDAAVASLESTKSQYLKEVFKDHAHRIQQISIRSHSYGSGQPLLDCLPASTPRLRILRLVFEHTSSALPWIPEHQLSSAQLSTLDLSNCSIKWTSPLLNDNLRELKMCNDRPTSTSSSILAEFTEALRKMHKLHGLHIANSMPSTDDAPTLQQSPIVLNALQKLYISSNAPHSLAFLLSCLVVPASTIVEIKFESVLQVGEPLASAFTTFLSSMRGSTAVKSKPYRTAFITGPGTGRPTFSIDLWKDSPMALPRFMRPSSPANFSLHLIGKETVFVEIISAMQLSGLRTLRLDGSLKSDHLVRISEGMDRLDTLRVDGCFNGASRVIKALGFCKDPADANFYFDVPFPRLKTLTMFGVVFAPQYGVDCVLTDDLLDCLVERIERKAPLQKLGIYSSYDIYGEEIGWLEEIVVDVDWDGEEQEYEPEDEEEEEEVDDEAYDYAYDDDGPDFFFGSVLVNLTITSAFANPLATSKLI